MTMHPEVLPDETKRLVEHLTLDPDVVSGFYLAGGTSLALQLGHRLSADLDFFSERRFDDRVLRRGLATIGDFTLERRDELSVLGTLNNVKVSFLTYEYQLLRPTIPFAGLQIADLDDIACMKLDAIASRGTKRDFVDLYFILRTGPSLASLLRLFETKYRAVRFNPVHMKKSLTHFQDADHEPMPKMLVPVDWRTIRSFFRNICDVA